MKRTSRRHPDKIDQDMGRARQRKNIPKTISLRFTTPNPLHRSTQNKRRSIQTSLIRSNQQLRLPRMPFLDMTSITQRPPTSRTSNSRHSQILRFKRTLHMVIQTPIPTATIQRRGIPGLGLADTRETTDLHCRVCFIDEACSRKLANTFALQTRTNPISAMNRILQA